MFVLGGDWDDVLGFHVRWGLGVNVMLDLKGIILVRSVDSFVCFLWSMAWFLGCGEVDVRWRLSCDIFCVSLWIESFGLFILIELADSA